MLVLAPTIVAVTVIAVVALTLPPREPINEPGLLFEAQGTAKSDELYGFPYTVPDSLLDSKDISVSIELSLADSRGYILFYLWECVVPACVTLTPDDPYYRWYVQDGTPLEFAKQTRASIMTYTFGVRETGTDQHFFFMFAQTVTLPDTQYELKIRLV